MGRSISDIYLGSPPGSASGNQNFQTLAYGYRRGWLQDNIYQGYGDTRPTQDASVRRRIIEPRYMTPILEHPNYGQRAEAAALPTGSQPVDIITSTPDNYSDINKVFDSQNPQ